LGIGIKRIYPIDSGGKHECWVGKGL